MIRVQGLFKVICVVEDLQVFDTEFDLIMIVFLPVVYVSLTHNYGKDWVGIVVWMDEICLDRGQLHLDFDQEPGLVHATFVLTRNYFAQLLSRFVLHAVGSRS